MSTSIDRVRAALAQSYSIDRELGRGGMATVFLAQDLRHDRVVALKVLHSDLAASMGPERFLREIRLAARLNHPHILPLFDSGTASDLLYYVMPYVEGESLRERLDRQRQLPIEEAVHITRSLAMALDYAHRQGVVHRDVKPENVMLHEGEAMIMDFGIAKAAGIGGAETLTQTGMMVGTPAYVSPEQASGETSLDGRSDQFSLGCVLYEMLAGERPFSGPTAQAVLARRFSGPVAPVTQHRSSVPPPVEKALTRAMSTEPSARYSSLALFAEALGSGSLTTPTDTASLPQPVISAAKSVAVLPFTNMSNDAENEYFTEGVAEEIINALTKIQSLRVASRTSAFVFKGTKTDIGEIGKRLKVSTVLEGSVRKAGNRIRISAQLVNVADGYHLWSERYDRELEDVFAIQDDISQAIAKALRVILTADEQKAIEKVRSVNVEAYDYYLRGRQYFHQWRRKGLEFARQMFNRAIETDPDYARAYAGVADASSLLYTYWDARDFNLKQADSASKKALELDPGLAEAHLARGIAVSLSKNMEEAEREFKKAIQLDPKLFEAPYFYGRACIAEGRYSDAASLFERAMLLNPEDFQAPTFLAAALRGMGKPDESIAARRLAMKIINERLELNPDDARALTLGATNSSKLGDEAKALELSERTLAVDPDDPMLLYNVACVYSVLGKTDLALDNLERAVDAGLGHRAWIDHDSDLDAVRGHPRFQKVVEAVS